MTMGVARPGCRVDNRATMKQHDVTPATIAT